LDGLTVLDNETTDGCSTPAPKSSAAKQWMKEELAQTKEEVHPLKISI